MMQPFAKKYMNQLNEEFRQDVTTRIGDFYGKINKDKNHRYLSWEHCFSYFNQDDIEVDKACLHMSFYLASWGMYRGSSFILWKDYLIHKEIVEKLISQNHLKNINFLTIQEKTIQEIMDLFDWIRDCYKRNSGTVNGKERKINVTDTLITKIILGSLGCIPAFDRYFLGGLKISGQNIKKPNIESIKLLADFYAHNAHSFDDVSTQIKSKLVSKYPAMKLIDMYFWQIGFDKTNGNKNLLP